MSKKELEQNGVPVEETLPEETGGTAHMEDGGAPEGAEGIDLNELLCAMDGNGAAGGAVLDPPVESGGAVEDVTLGPDAAAESTPLEDTPAGDGAAGFPTDADQPEEDGALPQDGGGNETSAPEKPKRASRKKKAAEPEPESAAGEDEGAHDGDPLTELPADDANGGEPIPAAGLDALGEDMPADVSGTATGDGSYGEGFSAGPDAPAVDPMRETPALTEEPIPAARPRRTTAKARADAPVLTIEARADVDTPEDLEEIAWHEIRNAYRTRRMLTGVLGGIEQTEARKTVAIVDYKGFRVVIPLKEMMIVLGRSPTGQEYTDLMLRQNKILGSMLGAEVDFVVKGIETKSRSVVASRKDAMLKKRQLFYLDADDAGMYRVHEGRVVQARVIAVAEKVIRVEVFGVECSIRATDLAWDWIGDAHDRYAVGDQVLVRVRKVTRDGLEAISIEADVKSVAGGSNADNLKKVRVQSKYAGRVTDVHRGVVFIRLSNGVNAIAHSCYDRRMPGKKDDVSFAVTHLDEDRGVAMGIITRIIKQNL